MAAVWRKTVWRKRLHEIPLQCDRKTFERFVDNPMCSHFSSCHQGSTVEDVFRSVSVEGNYYIPIVPGLLDVRAITARCQHSDETSSKREVMSLSSSTYARKGFLFPEKGKPTYVDHGMEFSVEGIEVGIEEILVVTFDFVRCDKKTKDVAAITLRTPCLTISAKMEGFSQTVTGFVQVNHYSSQQGWTQFKSKKYEEAICEVQRIEEDMSNVAGIVSKTPYDQLQQIRFVVSMCAQSKRQMALYIELKNTIDNIDLRLSEASRIMHSSDPSCAGDKSEKLKQLLEELQCVTMGECSSVFLENIEKSLENIL